ncbi:MAG TPA: translocation/assembly module TamB domain-containing protein [Candidatus Binatia bacterium]
MRRLLLSLVAVIAVLVIVVMALYGAVASGRLTSRLDAIITTLAQKKGSFFVTAEGVSGDDIPGHFRVHKVEVGDAYGVWLTVEDGEASWNPFDLFHPFDSVKWRVNVDDVHARHVLWTRLPRDGPDEPETPFHWDRFIRILVGHILVDDFELSGAILGGADDHVRAEGHGVLGEWDHGRVVLDIVHVDSATGHARVDLETHGSPLQLSGSIVAEEGAGGALAALARLRDAGAVTLNASGSGPMRDWKGKADVTAANIGDLHATTSLAFTADGPFEARGTFDPAPAQREKYLVGPGAPLAIHAKGDWAPQVEVKIDEATLDADGRKLAASGRLDLATRQFHVSGSLTRPSDDAPVVLTLLSAASARIDGSGVLGDGGYLDATLDVDAPSRADVHARSAHADFHARDVKGDSVPTYDLAATFDALGLGDGPLPLFGEHGSLQASGSIDLSAGVLDAPRFRAEGKDVVVDGPLSFFDDWKSMKASLALHASSLATLSQLAKTDVAGKAEATFEVNSRSALKDLDVDAAGQASGVAIAEAGWNALIGPEATFKASLHSAAGKPGHGDLEVDATGIHAAAKGDVDADGENLTADGNFRLDNLARLAEPARAAIAGRLEGSVSARGTLADFSMTAKLAGDRFSWEGTRFDRVTADVAADGLPSKWNASVRSRASYGKLDASLDAAASMPAPQRLVLRDVVLKGPQTDARASLDIDLEDRTASGKVTITSADLAAWRPMTGIALSGAVRADLTLGSRAGGRSGDTTLVSGSASIRGGQLPVGSSIVAIGTIDVEADGLELGATPGGVARLHAGNVRSGELLLADANAELRGDGRLWNVTSHVDVRRDGQLLLDLAGTLLSSNAPEVTLTRADGTAAGVRVSLAQPATLRLASRDAAKWDLSSLALALGDSGHVTVHASRGPSGVHIDGDATTLPLEVVSFVAPSLDLKGSVDGSVLFDGASLIGGSGSLTLHGHHIISADLEDDASAPLDVSANGTLGKGRLSGSASVLGLKDTSIDLTLDAPLSSAAAAGAVVVDLRWKGDVAQAEALLPIGEDQVSGHIDADLKLSGNVSAPRVTGRAVLDGGGWEHSQSGLVLRDVHAELEGDGTALVLRSLTATDSEKGRIDAHGRIDFQGFPAFDASFDLDAKNAMLARLDLVTAKADATISVRASRGAEHDAAVEGEVKGSVHVDDARIEIPQKFVADVPEIDVIDVAAQLEHAAELAPAPRRSRLALDVDVTGDNRIFLTGRGLDSEWSSDVHVRGDTADPRVQGTVTSVRGQLSLLGRRFDVTNGTLRFDGDKGNVPYLTLTAQAEANDITAFADITGPATKPTIELRSEPALPRDEVLSRVLFGQSAATLTPMQSIQLARSIAELTGSPLGGGGDFLGGIGRSIGLDRLGIDSTESKTSSGSSGAAALTASKYLTSNVYLRVQQGLTPETSALSLEWKVLKHITIESDVSQDAQGEVGATWRWDY